MKDVPIHALEKYPSNVMQQRTSPTPMVPEKSHFGPTGVNDQSQSSESQQQPRHVEVVVDMIDRKRETSTTDIKEKEPITHERKEQKEQKESWSWSPEKVAEWISSIDEPYKIYSHTVCVSLWVRSDSSLSSLSPFLYSFLRQSLRPNGSLRPKG